MKRDQYPNTPSADPPRKLVPTKNRFLTFSNFLSVFRALLSIPFFLIMTSERTDAVTWGIVIMLVGALTDRLDGDIARQFNQVTEWGKILDPVADKIGVATVVVVLLLLGKIPGWFVGTVLGRDILILAAGLWLKYSKGIVLPSNQTGKWAVGIISLTLFLSMIDAPWMWITVGIITSVTLLAASLFFYVQRFIKVVRS